MIWIKLASSFPSFVLEPKNGTIASMSVSMTMQPSVTRGGLTEIMFFEHGKAFAIGWYPGLVGTQIEIVLLASRMVYPCSQERLIFW